jgi:3,4-dihydroxy 2-butanone 4-phosphate synthase/GTP cyclohydrolase II
LSTSRQRADRVQKAIEDVRAGKMVILVDDEDRENEGDLTMAAEKVTPEAINFMAKHGRGLICLTLTEEKADALELPLQAARSKHGGSPFGTAFTVSIEARRGVTTGISAKDRATTILTAVAAEARPEDLITPGHVFPLRAKRGGVLRRTGQTEGSTDLARLAGLQPAGVICEIMNDDGSMARMPDLERFAAEHGLRILTIADLIEYRLERESLVERRAEAPITPGLLAAPDTNWQAHVFGTDVEQTEYLALTLGEVASDEPVLVRVQTACFPGDVFGSASCDCGAQLRAALQAIQDAGRGVFLYVHAAGRQSLLGDVKAHVLHETAPRVAGGEHKLRDFGLGAQVLQQLGVRNLRLLTNNPKKIVGLEGYGLCVVERVPIEVGHNQHNLRFLRDRRDREGHLFTAVRAAEPKDKE